jgi:hypothetical protein
MSGVGEDEVAAALRAPRRTWPVGVGGRWKRGKDLVTMADARKISIFDMLLFSLVFQTTPLHETKIKHYKFHDTQSKWQDGNLLQVTGDISYNGYRLDEFVPEKTAAYISQYDLHIPDMTVRETLDFSARCQGVGNRAGNPLFTK